MAINFARTDIKGSFPKIWRGEAKVLPGGFVLGQNLPVGTFIDRATLLHIDFAGRKAYIVKVAEVLEGSTTTKVRVKKGNHFQVGDRLTKFGDGSASTTINSINAEKEGYDELNLASAYTGLAAGDIVVESTALPENGNAEPLYTPDAVVAAKKQLDGKGLPVVDAAYEAVVLYPAVAYAVPAAWLDGFSLKNNHSIKFIKQ